ncbi:hypothetical protein EVAR_75234_1 [Eumeta japonica]|uniref:Uncharacterized protein n=1 Tax=Eumeta variegata TaxID=151549 RepID=A0A4C1V9E9_EUMVA|nr:hypothetical protein EVAR_75234_1 [Eumeta japonica]
MQIPISTSGSGRTPEALTLHLKSARLFTVFVYSLGGYIKERHCSGQCEACELELMHHPSRSYGDMYLNMIP